MGAPALREDAKLIADCVAGDASAWDELVERYGRLVYSVPLRAGFSKSDADDIFQIVFGILLRRLETLRDVQRLTSWLLRVTHRECSRFRRRSKARSAAELSDGVADDAEPSEEEIHRSERQQIVRQALTEMDGRCRELLEMLFFEHETPGYDDIAQRMSMPVGSIGPTRARCFKKLETILSRLGL